MRCNLKNAIRTNRSKSSVLAGLLENIVEHMEELRVRQDKGDGDAALAEFLDCWCIRTAPAPGQKGNTE